MCGQVGSTTHSQPGIESERLDSHPAAACRLLHRRGHADGARPVAAAYLSRLRPRALGNRAAPGLATLAVSMPAGLVADRLGARRVTIAATALMCLAALAQAAPSYPALL